MPAMSCLVDMALIMLYNCYERKYSILSMLFVIFKLSSLSRRFRCPQPSIPAAIIVIFVIFKLSCLSRTFLDPPPSVLKAEVTYDPFSLYDQHSGTFRVLDRANVTFVLEPRSEVCQPSTSLLLLALSSLDHHQQRADFRAEVKGRQGVALVFLVAEAATVDIQKKLEGEHFEHGDILQVSDPEFYKRISYKTLSGLLWAGLHCGHVNYVAKTDDNVSLDPTTLLQQLASKQGDFLSCPNPSRNFQPTRTTQPDSQTVKWSPTWEEMPRRTWPNFCYGWLWATTPCLGVALAEVAVDLEPNMLPLAKWDDSFITGFLRERLDVRLTTLTPGMWGALWDLVLSYCPTCSMWRNHLFNDIVLSKGPASMPYVNNWKFFICIQVENDLENLQTLLPHLSHILAPLWHACARK